VVVLRWPKPYRTVITLQGDTVAAADASLQPDRLHVHVAARCTTGGTERLILRQQPAAGGRLREGSAVQVTLSLAAAGAGADQPGRPAGPVAQGVLGALGLKSSTTTATSPTVKSGDVISATPDHGTLLPGQVVASSSPPGRRWPRARVTTAPADRSFAAAKPP